MSIPDTAPVSLSVSYILGMSFKIKVILVRKNYDKYFQTISQQTILKLHTLKCPSLPLDVDLDVASELISRVILSEFDQIIKFMYIYTI